MAFNHVGGCSCPVGCCDCGPEDKLVDLKNIAHMRIQELVPKDLYMHTESGELFELNRDAISIGAHLFYIGEIDPRLSIEEVAEVLFAFYGFMIKIKIPANAIGVRADLMNRLIRIMSDCYGYEEGKLASIVRPLFIYSGYYV